MEIKYILIFDDLFIDEEQSDIFRVTIEEWFAELIIKAGRFSFYDIGNLEKIKEIFGNFPNEILDYEYIFIVKNKIIWANEKNIEFEIRVFLEKSSTNANLME